MFYSNIKTVKPSNIRLKGQVSLNCFNMKNFKYSWPYYSQNGLVKLPMFWLLSIRPMIILKLFIFFYSVYIYARTFHFKNQMITHKIQTLLQQLILHLIWFRVQSQIKQLMLQMYILFSNYIPRILELREMCPFS